MNFDYIPYWQAGAGHASPRAIKIDLRGFRDDDFIAVQIARRRTFYEDDLLEHVALRGPLGGTYLDVGANIGNHSVFFGKFLADHVIAIEPNPAVMPVLRRNLEANGISSFTLVPTAVGAEKGRGRLVLPARHVHNIGGTQIAMRPPSASVADDDCEDVIPVATLDEVIAQLDLPAASAISLLKIDVEGMELAVLEGARSLLSRDRPQILIELATAEAYERAFDFLAGYGYSDVGKRFGETPTYHFTIAALHKLRNVHQLTKAEEWAHEVRKVEIEVTRVIPALSTFILVDEDQFATNGTFAGGRAIPFVEQDGAFYGLPTDDEQAISELERLRAHGASFVVFVPPTFWWLDYFVGLRHFLRTRFTCRMATEHLIVFDLRSAPVGHAV